MKIVVLGLNHKTAPVEIREKLAFDTAETSRALCELKKRFGQAESYLYRLATVSNCIAPVNTAREPIRLNLPSSSQSFTTLN